MAVAYFNNIKEQIDNIVIIDTKKTLNKTIKLIIIYSNNDINHTLINCDKLLTDLINKINKKGLYVTSSDIDKIYSDINKILKNDDYFNWIIKNIELGFIPDDIFIKKYIYSFSYETCEYLYKNYEQEFITNSLLPFTNYNFMHKLFSNKDKLFTETEDLIQIFDNIDNVMKNLNLNIKDVFNNMIHFYWPKNSEYTLELLNNIYQNVMIYCRNRNINIKIDILNIDDSNDYEIKPIYNFMLQNLELQTYTLDEIKNKLNKNISLASYILIPKNFIKIYDKKDNDKLLYYLPVIFNQQISDYFNKILILFKYLIEEENLELTHDLFLYYCKLGIPHMIEYFLENKFIPNNEIFLNLNPDKYIQCMCIFVKYNYYINDDILDEIWIKLIGNSISVSGFIKYTIYVNDVELHKKIIERLINVRLNYTDINNLSLADLIFYNDTINLETIILLDDYEKRKLLLEKYMKENIKVKTKIIRKIIKKKVVNK
jgi:hypothetical protein